MILENQEGDKVVKLVESAKNIGICVAANPSQEEVLLAAGLGLALDGEERKSWFSGNFDVKVNFPYKDLIQASSGNRDLVITLPYKEEDINRIVSQTVNGQMKIVVEPKEEVELVDKSRVQISYQGLKVDVIFLVGVKALSDLGEVYDQNRLVFQEVPIVHLHKPGVVGLGKVNVEIRNMGGVVEVVEILEKMDEVNEQGLSVLLWTLRYLTDNFKPPVAAEALEKAAWLIKHGAEDIVVEAKAIPKPIWQVPSWTKTNKPPVPQTIKPKLNSS